VTGEYTFWIASNDNSVLYLSTDQNPDNSEEICKVTGWTNVREWDKFTQQTSKAISLEGGKVYYIEALMKESTASDNLAVAWMGPNFDQVVIDGTYLSPWILE